MMKKSDVQLSLFFSADEPIDERFPLKKEEIYRYMRSRVGVDRKIDRMIDECLEEVREYSRFKYVYRTGEIDSLQPDITFTESSIRLPGNSIRKHVRGARTLIFFAVSLGVEIHRRIDYHGKTDLLRGFILDACATAFVEACCDELHERIRAEAEEKGFYLTSRFSPGYGDLPLSVQPSILSYLNAFRRIGLYVSDSFILLPRKSVTGIMGLGEEKKEIKSGCTACRMFGSCPFSREGEIDCAQ